MYFTFKLESEICHEMFLFEYFYEAVIAFFKKRLTVLCTMKAQLR